ncbi:hypothetical protein L3556_13925 [Candidatus Synechococcus calcipolaris G9]|uniref:Uncharacterized protein n=1 Tax=Candidatus Synechococcus calcipolaris G9 TaxID=1497997 RepID=A0ABT6F2D5_9SYNE|nr:hypothetical protein [Candidatus Synechococcus calcipolaris]MDG2992019.1 hypothetical protein [Candidatus Synechococcus calcipolaris G9]
MDYRPHGLHPPGPIHRPRPSLICGCPTATGPATLIAHRPIRLEIAAHRPHVHHRAAGSVPMGQPDHAPWTSPPGLSPAHRPPGQPSMGKMPKNSPLKTLKHSPPLGPRQETRGYRMHRSNRGYHRAATPWGPHIAHSSLEDSYRAGPYTLASPHNDPTDYGYRPGRPALGRQPLPNFSPRTDRPNPLPMD